MQALKEFALLQSGAKHGYWLIVCMLVVTDVDEEGSDAPIPLPNVNAKILAKVIEYCKYQVEARGKSKDSEDKPAQTEEDSKNWEAEFVKVDQNTLFELILVCSSKCSH